MAVARPYARGQADIGLPQPLSPSEAVRLHRIFALHAHGIFAQASREAADLDLPWLQGTLLADRLLSPGYRPTADELKAWLTHYGEAPEAPLIRARLQPSGADRAASLSGGPVTLRPTPLSHARALFVANRDADAIAAATVRLKQRRGPSDADALFAAGLAAWRLSNLDDARVFFQAALEAAHVAEDRAAASFWAARAEEWAHDPEAQATWLRRSAQETGTFYGRLAQRTLASVPTCLGRDLIATADLDALLARPPGRRAFALLQVGEMRRAEAEFRALWAETWPDPGYTRALALVAQAAGLSQLAADLRTGRPAEPPIMAAVPRLRPQGGFVVDPPLVYALVRNESNFQPQAVSQLGARGLMQIMPTTATEIGAVPAGAEETLHDPAVNLAVGQRYLLLLARDKSIDGNLLRLLAAYAQGPGGMRRWADEVNDAGDPLMFLEAIPSPAIAVYVKAALSAAWSYAAAMHVPAPSLDALAAKSYPRLVHAEHRRDSDMPPACGADLASR